MKILFILLFYNLFFYYGLGQDNSFSSSCNSTCILHSTSLIPIFSLSASEVEVDLLKLHLLSQVDTCFRNEFSVEVYLSGTEEWFSCCGARSCSRGILDLTKEDFISKRFKGVIDSKDASGIVKLIDKLSIDETKQIYVLSNFMIPQLWTPKKNTKYTLINDSVSDSAYKNAESSTIQAVANFTELMTLDQPFCSKKTHKMKPGCPPDMPAESPQNVDIRIFLGFTSRGHFSEIIEGLGKFLSVEYFDEHEGKIIFLGPRATFVGRCWWYNVHKCILELQLKGEEAIHVNAETISRDDVEFAPDVMGFMRKEAIQRKEVSPTFALVISDFISINFLDNKYIFQKALANQRVALVLGLMLSWNGLDTQTAKKYYGGLLNSDALYPMEVFADLNGLTDRILNISFNMPEYNDTTTVLPPHPTDSSNHTSDHPTDVVIVLALAYWTDEIQLALLKKWLDQKTYKCVNKKDNYAIEKNSYTDLVFCPDSYCLSEEISQVDASNALSQVDNAYELVQEALDILDPSRAPAEQMPSIILVTNYISKVFMKYYDDSGSGFRTKLSFVDFEVLLINASNDFEYLRYSSLNKKILHIIPTFEELEQDKYVFCQDKAIGPPPQDKEKIFGTEGIIILCVSSVLLFIAVLAIVYSIRKNRKTKRKSRRDDRIPIISKDLDNLGQEILNISGLARTREDPWQMSRQQIIQGTELGRGSGGVVFRGSILGRAPCEFIYRRNFYAFQYDNCPVAIKEQLIGSDEKGRQQLLDEIEIMKAIRPHQNIANMLGCVTNVNPVCLVLEYAENGCIKQFIKGKFILPAGTQPCADQKNILCQRDVLSYLWQISNALAFVHHCGVIHRDVAARNVLLQRGRDILLADFGLAIWRESQTSYTKIKRLPIKWTSPEALSKAQFSEASDVWSFGVCAWEILMSGEDPFNHVQTPEILSYLNSGRRLERPQACNDQLWKILRSCWHDDPNKRPKFNELKAKLGPLLEDICGYGYIAPQME